jgi:hypothetical protein
MQWRWMTFAVIIAGAEGEAGEGVVREREKEEGAQ